MSIFNYFSKEARLNRLMVEAEGLIAEHRALACNPSHYIFCGGPALAGKLARVAEKISQLKHKVRD